MKHFGEKRIGGDFTADIKLSVDPATGYPVVEFKGHSLVLKKNVKIQDLEEKGLSEIVEAQVA